MFSDDFLWMNIFITARKRSLRRLCFYRCVSVHGGVCLSACWDTPCQGDPPAKETPLPRRPPMPRRPPYIEDPLPRRPPTKETPLLLQAHTQGRNWGGSDPGPHPRGKLRGIKSRPTPKGEIEGDQIQAHTQGGNWGGSDPGLHPRGKFRGIRSRQTSKWEIQGDQDQTPHNYCCGQYASYWNAFLLQYCAQIKFSHTHTHTHHVNYYYKLF